MDQIKFMGSYQTKFHIARFNHVILSKEVLQKIETIVDEDQQAKE
jgi:hypothetical protein